MGNKIGDARLAMAVNTMLSAISPFAKYVNTFEVAPPGHKETNNNPAQAIGSKGITKLRKSAIRGRIKICKPKPNNTTLGLLST